MNSLELSQMLYNDHIHQIKNDTEYKRVIKIFSYFFNILSVVWLSKIFNYNEQKELKRAFSIASVCLQETNFRRSAKEPSRNY